MQKHYSGGKRRKTPELHLVNVWSDRTSITIPPLAAPKLAPSTKVTTNGLLHLYPKPWIFSLIHFLLTLADSGQSFLRQPIYGTPLAVCTG